MVRHRALSWTLIGMVLVSLACNAFAGTVEPALPPPPTMVATAPPSTTVIGDIAPTATLPATAANGTATPDVPTVQAIVDLNVRTGPGVVYDKDGFLLQGDTAPIIGRDPESGWWQITCPVRSSGPGCWVSGRSQYTAVANVDKVPIASVPPTPTPRPANLGAIAAFVENGRLQILPLDLNQSPVRAGTPAAIGERSDVLALKISPDGSKIAYLAGRFNPEELRIVNVDGSGDRQLVSVADLPLPPGLDVESWAAVVAQITWLADSRTLVFNTDLLSASGSQRSQEDLWTVDMTGAARQVLAPGAGGAVFAVAPDGRIILSQAAALIRADIQSGASERLIQFEQVNTASEYIYYPLPQWTADGSRALVAVPSREQFTAAANATLWQITATGTADQLGTLPGNILFNPVVWSPNGERLAYVHQRVDGSNIEPMLMVARTAGQDAGTYNSAEQITFLSWSADNLHFLYSTGQFLAVGQAGSGPVTVSLPAAQLAQEGQWVTAADFVVAVGSPTVGWTLSGGNLNGDTTPLVTFGGPVALMDVWAP